MTAAARTIRRTVGAAIAMSLVAACSSGGSSEVVEDDLDYGFGGGSFGYAVEAGPDVPFGPVDQAALSRAVDGQRQAVPTEDGQRFGVSVAATFAELDAAQEAAETMRDLLADAAEWYAAAGPDALATLRDDDASAPLSDPERIALAAADLSIERPGVGWIGPTLPSADVADAVVVIGRTVVVRGLRLDPTEARPNAIAELLAAAGADVLVEGDRAGEGAIVTDATCRTGDAAAARRLGRDLIDQVAAPYYFWLRPPWVDPPLTDQERLARSTLRAWLTAQAEAITEDPRFVVLAAAYTDAAARGDRAAMAAAREDLDRHVAAITADRPDGELDPAVLADLANGPIEPDEYAAWGARVGAAMGQLPLRERAAGPAPAPGSDDTSIATATIRVDGDRVDIGWLSALRWASAFSALVGYLDRAGCTELRYRLVDFDDVRGD